jgi:hypothetical protein
MCMRIANYIQLPCDLISHEMEKYALGIVRTFFGLNFVISTDCITIDQTDKCEKIVTQVFGPSWRLQKPKGTHNIPMKAGSTYAELLARSPPLSDADLASTEVYFGFKYRSILGACVHLAIWTRLDILLACVVLAQFQTSTGVAHFEALKHMVGYLRRNPDIPLTDCHQRFDASVSFLHLEINEADALQSEIFSSSLYHVGSVNLITRTQDLVIASALLFETDEACQVFCLLEPSVNNVILFSQMNLSWMQILLNFWNRSTTPSINFLDPLVYLALHHSRKVSLMKISLEEYSKRPPF